jgi:pimeloyl-ACP methyl ester carboxylesterase
VTGSLPAKLLWIALVGLVVAAAGIAYAFFSERIPHDAHAAKTYTGRLPDGASYLIEVPPHWNGRLALWSHGYVPPGFPNHVTDVSDSVTRALLLDRRYALAGSSYSSTGYAVEQGIADQLALDDIIPAAIGTRPKRTIAWGGSLGGMVTAALVQRYPHRFEGALPLCGVLAGSVAAWNSALDFEYAFKTLLAPQSSLELVRIKNGGLNALEAERTLADAQGSPAGRARLALATAVFDLPGWFDRNLPEPARDNYDARELNQRDWVADLSIPFYFGWRQELESRAGGNGSWNSRVDYRVLFLASTDREEVEALYRRAGLNLETDLAALDRGARVSADPPAVAYLRRNIEFNGMIGVPVLTMHTIADGLVGVSHEAAYRVKVTRAGNGSLLRQVFVRRAGHCAFTPSEAIAAFEVLNRRIDTGKWPDVSPATMNRSALKIGSSWALPSFVEYTPEEFPRH